MKNNVVVLCLIVALAVLLGIGIIGKTVNDPLMKKLVSQQQEILSIQQKMVKQIATQTEDQNTIRIKSLEERIAALEKKIETMNVAQRVPPQAPTTMPPSEDFTKVYDLPKDKSPLRGNASAKVTITGFLDLQCPFSARFQPVIDQVQAAYPGKVNYMIKHFPLSFHPQAKPAAKAVLAAGEQGKYWDMLELILKDNRNLSEEKLKEFAKTIKLDMRKFEADLKNKDAQWEQQIQSEFELGTKSDVRGTPTYYVNGRKSMSRDLEGFKKEIETILNSK